MFSGTLDLRGSQIRGRFDAADATFQQPLLLAKTFIGGTADFSSAIFANAADFTDAQFGRIADFSLARFGDDVDFSDSEFGDAAAFTSAVFARTASFRQTAFRGQATFEHVSFRGAATFRRARFARPVSFASSSFRSTGTFSGDEFFRSAGFQEVSASGDLDFSDAYLGPAFDVSDLNCSSTVSFSNALIPRQGRTYFGGFSAHGLVLDVDAIRLIAMQTAAAGLGARDLERRLLALTEATAKTSGAIATANDADYRLHVLASQTDPWPVRILDVVFYRLVAGYLVRPLQPLLTLLALAALLSLVRTRKLFIQVGRSARAGELGKASVWLADSFTKLLNECWNTIARAFSRDALGDAPDARLSSRLELLVFRVLVICILIGLANSNSTLRQLAHAVA
jgi:hypothetical protein